MTTLWTIPLICNLSVPNLRVQRSTATREKYHGWMSNTYSIEVNTGTPANFFKECLPQWEPDSTHQQHVQRVSNAVHQRFLIKVSLKCKDSYRSNTYRVAIARPIDGFTSVHHKCVCTKNRPSHHCGQLGPACRNWTHPKNRNARRTQMTTTISFINTLWTHVNTAYL